MVCLRLVKFHDTQVANRELNFGTNPNLHYGPPGAIHPGRAGARNYLCWFLGSTYANYICETMRDAG